MSSVSSSFTCGIDIGTKNMCITFVGDDTIVSYHGSFTHLTRYEIDKERTRVIGLSRSGPYHEYTSVLSQISEFRNTSRAIIEKQVARNQAIMHFIEGCTFGYIRSAYPNIDVAINGSTIRRGFLQKKIGNRIHECKDPEVLKGKDTKKLSYAYVSLMYPQTWAFFKTLGIKLDDLSDAIVYADIAYSKDEASGCVYIPTLLEMDDSD
jgi:hypothetical protein